MTMRSALPWALLLLLPAAAAADPIGEVDTVFQWIGPDHKIVVEAYDDPKVTGVTCYLSRASGPLSASAAMSRA